MPKRWAVALRACLLAVVIASCDGSSNGSGVSGEAISASASASASHVPCASVCSGKEVTETGCDKSALDAIPDTFIPVLPYGTLALRKSNPAVCTRIYWARFTPVPENNVAFTVTVLLNGTASKAQPSEPRNPAVTAWTVGVYGKPGDRVQPCVTAARQRWCLPATTVV
jgi:hypothetical protein